MAIPDTVSMITTGLHMRTIFVGLGLLMLVGCGGPQRFVAPDPPPDDRRPTREVPERKLELWGDLVGKTTTYQTRRFFDLSRYFRAMAGRPKEAYNVDAFDQPAVEEGKILAKQYLAED